MIYVVNYAVVSHKGNIRKKNQDNFWCMGKFLESDNNGVRDPITGTIESDNLPAFAVFDGMGGEQKGEMAAYIATKHFDIAYAESSEKEVPEFLLKACLKMNDAICKYSLENQIRSMGTTAAILMFSQSDIYACNIGDSRIYKCAGKKMHQISHDHINTNILHRKPPLTQNLGIPASDFIIEPYMKNEAHDNHNKYLICSDGLTDMVEERDIADIIYSYDNLRKCTKELLKKALNAGGNDNITIILCELHKTKQSLKLKKIIQSIAGGISSEY